MGQEKLLQELQRLRGEIEKINSADTESRNKLEQLLQDIEAELDKADEDEASHGLIEDLRESISRFETEHPRTTAILNDIMVTLSNMGI